MLHKIRPFAVAAIVLTTSVLAHAEPVTANGVIKGTMNIDFKSRYELDTAGKFREGSAKQGVKDIYNVNLTLNDFINFAGQITRQPNLYGRVTGRRAQEAEFYYDLNVSVVNPSNPSQSRNVGKWVGLMPVEPGTGTFLLDGGRDKQSPLRLDINSVGSIQAFKDPFSGRLVGKAENKEGLASYTYRRWVSGKEVAVTVQRVDPMKFENIKLAQGPTPNYPSTNVNGRLDYDYETGNYYADGIRMVYTINGQQMTDVITGSIQWVEDPDRAANGKGRYEFNLRFNEESFKSQDEAAAFEAPEGLEAFFAVDNNIPTLTGTIEYVDSFDGETVTKSQVTYNLNANKLERHQIANFLKLWLIAVGPTNDE